MSEYTQSMLLLFSFMGQAFGFAWQIVSAWWWLLLPFFLRKPFVDRWKWWRNYVWLRTKYKSVLLEIKLPKETEKPIRAMEDVMASIHGVVYQPPDWWEEWIEGQLQTSIHFEIASLGGDIHFYFKVNTAYRDGVEASIYAHYPDAEITQVDDYMKTVPQDIPNREWTLWGSDYKLLKPDFYPILTYKSFEKEKETLREEQKVDPVATLMEAFSKVSPDERFWITISCKPISEADVDKWIAEAHAERDRIVGREAKAAPKQKPILLEVIDLLLKGPEEAKQEEEKRELYPEMKLTPGEKEIVKGMEDKISKPIFLTNIRFVFLGKRASFAKSNYRLGFSFFSGFMTLNLNALVPLGRTIIKIKHGRFLPVNLLIPRRLYVRQRKMFRQHVARYYPFFPEDAAESRFKMNTEEIASLFHFPSARVSPVPTVARVEAKRTPPPGFAQ